MRSRALKAFGLTASFLALFFMLGGHWFVLQSVAWGRMFVEFAKADSISEALEKTFDGDHPCKMCLRIRDGRQQEQREQEAVPLLKTEKASELICDVPPISAPMPRDPPVTSATWPLNFAMFLPPLAGFFGGFERLVAARSTF